MRVSMAWVLLELALKVWAKKHQKEFEILATGFEAELAEADSSSAMSKSERMFKSVFVRIHKAGDVVIDSGVLDLIDKLKVQGK